MLEQGTPEMPAPLNHPESSPAPASKTSRRPWPPLLDPDFLYRWATLLILPLFVIWPGFKSEIFVIYAVLFGLQVWHRGYVRCGLEPWLLLGLLGLSPQAKARRQMSNIYVIFFIRLKLFIFKCIVWNSQLIMNSGENSYHARFI